MAADKIHEPSDAGGALAVTIVACCYNQESYVRATLDSIAAQTWPHIELVVVDDGSTDQSADRIRTWAAGNAIPCRTVFNDANLGICASLNRVLPECRGKYVQIIACDDVLDPRKVERQVEVLEASPDCAAAWSNFRIIGPAGEVLNRQYYPDDFRPPDDPCIGILRKYITGTLVLHAPTVLVRKRVLDEFLPIPEGYQQEDFYIWLNITFRYAVRFLPDTLVDYRKLPNSLARRMTHALSRRKGMLEDQLEVIESLIPGASEERLGALLRAKLRRYTGLQRIIASGWEEESPALAEIREYDELKREVAEEYPRHRDLVDEALGETAMVLWKGALPFDHVAASALARLPFVARWAMRLHVPPSVILKLWRLIRRLAAGIGLRREVRT